MEIKKGKIIATFGIPGCGKSTVTKELGSILKIETFNEPEEDMWADAVKQRTICGNFTALMWFRSIRVPMIYEAFRLKEMGITSILDSYYDKLFSLYLNKQGIEWLIDKNDPYYNEILKISRKDYKILPNADIIIFLKLNKATWKKFTNKRNRVLDRDPEFKKSFILQQALLNAAKLYSNENRCKLIIYNQNFSSAKIAALEISKRLLKEI